MKNYFFIPGKKSVCIQVLFLLLIVGTTSGALSVPEGILLISWDGVSKETLQTLLESDSLPHLSSLLRTGSFINISITDHYPDAKAGHAQILTGYSPEQTGVFKNIRFGEIPHGMTVFERITEAFGQDNISTAVVASQERNLGITSGLPLYHAGKVLDYYYDLNSNAGLLSSVTSEVVYHFGQKGKFFIFAHFKDASDAGYIYGAGSPGQIDAIKEIDEGTGRILQILKDLGLFKKTTIYITTDHGFNSGPDDNIGQYALWMVTNEPGYNQTGDQKDITPTILKRFGIPYHKMTPPYSATALIPDQN